MWLTSQPLNFEKKESLNASNSKTAADEGRFSISSCRVLRRASAAANGNLKSGQWQIVSEQTGTIQGTVPWITRAADKTADTDKDHVTVTIDRGDRKIVTEGDKQFHVGDKVTVNWAIGDTEGDPTPTTRQPKPP